MDTLNNVKIENKQLIHAAMEAQKNAYAPYSNFKVGCAILSNDGKIIKGCNIENIAGTSNCAERTAMYSAIAQGVQSIYKIAIIGDGLTYCYPCGTCRQVIMEHNPEAIIICAKSENDYEEYSIHELLPYAFSPQSLKK